MKNISVILVAIVVLLAILEAKASRPNSEERKFIADTKSFKGHVWSLGKNNVPHLDPTEATMMQGKRGDGTSGMMESDGQEKDSSTDNHHYFPCAKQSECGNKIRT